MKNTGVIFTLTAGISWGFSGACSQYIFDMFHADPTYLTAYRLLCAGLILVILGFFTDQKSMIRIWKDPADALHLVIFAVAGLMFCQLSYMKAISYSNSGTATILQYIGPVLVMIVSCFMARKLPAAREVAAIALALTGTFFIATHGDIHTMILTPAGLIWGLLAAVALMLYTLIPVKITARFGSIVTTGYGMLIGGIILFVLCRGWQAPMIYDYRCILAFVSVVLFGTVLTFTLYMAGVTRCGAVKASMLASIEPVSATVFMVVWLKEPFAPMDLIGFLCIFAMVFLLTKKESSLGQIA